MDTLSDYLDVRSLKIINASSVMNINIQKATGRNIVRFDFPAINLLDSSHHGYCDGSVIFSIKSQSGLPAGAMIENHAGIFFDDNPVVMTNAVVNTVGCSSVGVPAVSKSDEILLYPNPATDELAIVQSGTSYTALSVFNTLGQQYLHQQISSTKTNLDIHGLPPGLYYVALHGLNGNVVKKFVKL
jgi:hypothetical protein